MMRIAVAQISCIPGDVAANCAKILRFVDQARGRGCQAIVLPELIDTGYDITKLAAIAAPWDLDDSTTPLAIVAEAAREAQIFVICGLSERVGEKIYNTTAVIDKQGQLLTRYRKAHLAAYALFDEDQYVAAGGALATAALGELDWGLIICYDLRFPEISRALTVAGAEVIALSSAWPFPRLGHWQTLIRARAIENQAYLIAANRVGIDAGVTFCGASCIIDPYGVTVAAAAVDREELIVGEISGDLVHSVREYMPVLDQRREDLYQCPGSSRS